jgi:uncharacterized membrane protein
MTDAGEVKSWRLAPGWMKALLLASLLGNAAIAGIASGMAARQEDERFQPNEPGLNRQQTRILHMVPEARRDMAREILLARADELAAAREAMRAAQAEIMEALRADPFSRDRMAVAMEARRMASRVIWGGASDQMVEIAEKLTAAERAEMADAMAERYRRWAERREGKK